jgi:hypothetical protein
MKQQTAVEYLIEQLFPKALSEEQYYHIEKAKEMEKEQIVNSWDLSRRDIDYPANGEQYYNETYKNK